MAVVKSSKNKIKNTVAGIKAIEYITNPEKTFMVSTENCYGNAPNDLATQFKQLRIAHNQDKGILAHHYIQSFSPDDNITPEQAHQIGLEFIKRVAPNYQIIVATHIDKAHIHNHFFINSCNIETGYKWHDNLNTLGHLQDVSDGLCRVNDLSVIDRNAERKGIDQTTYQLAMKGKSWKVNLVNDLDVAIKSCKGKAAFIDFLNEIGYHVRYTDNHITITKIGEKKGVRVDTLAKQFGDKYKKLNIEKGIGISPPVKVRGEKSAEHSVCRQKKEPLYVNEFQRYEKWFFDRKPSIKPPSILSAGRSNSNPSNSAIFSLRLLFYIMLRSAIENRTLTSPATPTRKYKPIKVPKAPARKFSIKTAGNIPYNKLIGADGDNFTVRISTEQLAKVTTAPFFYSSRLNINNSTATITIKATNKYQLSEILGVSVVRLDAQDSQINNQRIYGELKKKATASGSKPEYKVVSSCELIKLRSAGIELAFFEKGDKFNISFLPKQKEAIERILRPEKLETELQRNNRINNEIKAEAMRLEEKPCYRIVTSEQLEAIRATGIKFAVFEKEGKYNIVSLRANEDMVKSALFRVNGLAK
jgi:hypothetical protein